MTFKAHISVTPHVYGSPREAAPEGFPYVVRIELKHTILGVFKEHRMADLFTDGWNKNRTHNKAYIDYCGQAA